MYRETEGHRVRQREGKRWDGADRQTETWREAQRDCLMPFIDVKI